jgi:hypothetical protein
VNGYGKALLGVALMSCYDIDFVALDLTLQDDRGAAGDDPFAKLLDHRQSVILVDIQFLSYL